MWFFSESYSVGTRDFKTQLTKIIKENPDGLVLLGYDETGIIMKQARELGFIGQFYTTGTVTSLSLQKASQGNAEGTIFAFWSAPKDKEPTKSFTEKFKKIKGREPILDLATYPTYDSVNVIAEAMKKSENISELKKSILNVKMNGVTGEISFNKDGGMRILESAYVLKDGKPVPIEI